MEEKIPRKAYYIWIGDKEKPEIFKKCYNSWEKHLKGFEIIELNNYNIDIDRYMKNEFFKTCYEKKLFAYCSDYIRADVLYKTGGIYLDIDMQLLKSIDEFLVYDFFIAYESPKYFGVGLYGAAKNSSVLGKLLNFYENEIYKEAVWTIPKILTKIITENGYIDNKNYRFLEKELFYPLDLNETFKESMITEETYAIHWWNASWVNLKSKLFLETKHLSGIKKIMKKIKIVLRVFLKGY